VAQLEIYQFEPKFYTPNCYTTIEARTGNENKVDLQYLPWNS